MIELPSQLKAISAAGADGGAEAGEAVAVVARAGEGRLDARQQAGERVGLGAGKIGGQRAQALVQEPPCGAERPLAGRRQSESLAAAVTGDSAALEQPGVRKAGEELRDRGAGDAGAARELGSGHALAGDRSQREVLRERQRGLVASEQPLDPAADERRDRHQPLRGVGRRVTRLPALDKLTYHLRMLIVHDILAALAVGILAARPRSVHSRLGVATTAGRVDAARKN